MLDLEKNTRLNRAVTLIFRFRKACIKRLCSSGKGSMVI